jgi:hypothetical protein
MNGQQLFALIIPPPSGASVAYQTSPSNVHSEKLQTWDPAMSLTAGRQVKVVIAQTVSSVVQGMNLTAPKWQGVLYVPGAT